MAIPIEMPKLSDTMTEGTLVKWLKQPGDTVEIGDVIAEVETDKATMEMEAFDEGVILEIRVQEGEKAPIGSTLAVLGEEGESAADIPAAVEAPAPAPAKPSGEDEAAPAEAPVESPAPAAAEPAPPPAQPAAPSPAAEPAPAPAPAVGPGGRIKSSPLARKVAAELGVDLAAVTGTGPAGRIVRADVEAAAKGGAPAPAPAPAPSADAQKAAGLAAAAKSKAVVAPAPAAAPAPAPAAGPAAIRPVVKEGDQVEEISTMRRIIADRLLLSKQTIPHFYLHVEVDAAPLMELRKQVNTQAEQTHGNKYTINDFVLKAVIDATRHVPAVNASFAGDSIVRFSRIGLSIAVAVDDGLVTPVVKNADSKSLLAISREVKDLAARAKERKLRPDEFDDGTITVSSLGAWGIESFDAIVNPPQAVILSVGAAVEKPVVVDGQVVPGLRMNVGLSCDHRVVDGAIGAQFLGEVKRLLEQPALMLI
jgi:pyruvate dehydrogenase E2 component (dihydrolipoamide acetyltransferase)